MRDKLRPAAAVIVLPVLLLLGAGSVSADHGYWPEGGVTPAKVSRHAPATPEATRPSYWGSSCRTVGTEGAVTDGALDVYGALLMHDYGLAVIVAAGGPRLEDPEFLQGPYGLTIFESPKKGEFVWADADGDGRFAGKHEADSTLLIVCAAQPPDTSTVDVRRAAGRPAWLFPAFAFGALLVSLLFRRLGDRWAADGR